MYAERSKVNRLQSIRGRRGRATRAGERVIRTVAAAIRREHSQFLVCENVHTHTHTREQYVNATSAARHTCVRRECVFVWPKRERPRESLLPLAVGIACHQLHRRARNAAIPGENERGEAERTSARDLSGRLLGGWRRMMWMKKGTGDSLGREA